jgi:hypothetical protein
VALTVRISAMTQTAELLEDGEPVAERKFRSDEQDQALFTRALELAARHNNMGVIALLWPDRVESNGHGQT